MDRSPFIKIPSAVRRAGLHHDWGYRSEPDASRDGMTEKWTRGRVVGGSSSINGTLFVRGAAADFDGWNVPGWSARDVLPIFRAMERSDRPGPLRGRSGPLYVRTVKRPHLTTEAFIDAARAAGFGFNEDYNGEQQEGVGFAQLSQHHGFRCSASDAFLKPLLGRKNLKLVVNAHVDRIEMVDGRAVAVSFHRGRARCRETAGDVVLCAGAINSPKLLMLSGIGDELELARHGIRTVLHLPGVGRNLKEHPLITLTFKSRIPTNNLTEGPLQRLRMALEFFLHGEGGISNLFEGTAFVRSGPAAARADLQLIFMTRGFERLPDDRVQLASYPSVSVHVIGSYPQSAGRIRLSSAASTDPPRIECCLLEAPEDLATLIKGIHIVRRIMRTNPMGALIDSEIAPGADLESARELESFVRRHTGIAYHPIGTCRMGSDEHAVVDASLRVHGTENLWVADASVVPSPLSANMNAACMMIGKMLGQRLVERAQSDSFTRLRSAQCPDEEECAYDAWTSRPTRRRQYRQSG